MATAGTELREAHYPGRAPIDSYGRGGFRFASMSHRGALICVPSGIYAWPEGQEGELSDDSMARALLEADEIDVLLVGTGTDLVPLPPRIQEQCSAAGIMAECMSTGPAVRTFNVLLADGRRVAAALMPVD
ncbi:MAG: Mth938-like domain-containing protein [Alphaproteobacteria bacterium]